MDNSLVERKAVSNEKDGDSVVQSAYNNAKSNQRSQNGVEDNGEERHGWVDEETCVLRHGKLCMQIFRARDLIGSVDICLTP